MKKRRDSLQSDRTKKIKGVNGDIKCKTQSISKETSVKRSEQEGK